MDVIDGLALCVAIYAVIVVCLGLGSLLLLRMAVK